jgi:TolB-like protein
MKATPHLLCVIALSAALAGCAATHTTSFLHPEFDFSQVERVAVVPFEDLSNEPGTGSYVSRVFLTELLATGAFDVVEPGEVTRIIGEQSRGRSAELTYDQIKKVGTDLNVQAVVFGTVGESADLPSGGVGGHTVSLDVRMVEVATGSTIWSAVVNTGGPGFFARLFGAGDQTRGTAVRTAVRKAISTLVK